VVVASVIVCRAGEGWCPHDVAEACPRSEQSGLAGEAKAVERIYHLYDLHCIVRRGRYCEREKWDCDSGNWYRDPCNRFQIPDTGIRTRSRGTLPLVSGTASRETGTARLLSGFARWADVSARLAAEQRI
jgi:hypothetical protein